MQKIVRNQTLGEEIANAISHGIGALLSIFATVLLIVLGAKKGDTAAIITAAFYGTSLITLYTSSTLYHSLSNKKAKKVFRILDHCNIFILITGTYAPISVLMIGENVGYLLLISNLICCILGIVLNAINIKKFKVISMILYVFMGWMCIFIAKPLIMAIPINQLLILFLGGVSYTIGIIFFAIKKIKYMHFIWHIFVLIGSVLQYIFILQAYYL